MLACRRIFPRVGLLRSLSSSTASWAQTSRVSAYLQQHLPLSPEQLDTAARKHEELARAVLPEVRQNLFFLRSEVGLPPGNLAGAIRRHPALLTRELDELEASLACVMDLASGLDGAALVRGCPQVLLTAAGEMRGTHEALHERSADVRTILTKSLEVLAQPASQTTELFAFLEADVGLEPSASGRLASDYPALLTYSVGKQLRPMVAFLRERGVDPSTDACRPLFAWPNAELVMAPALELLSEAGYEEAELLAEPSLLCYSFELRLRPRLDLVRERLGRRPGAPGALAALPPLRLLSEASNADFCATVGCSAKELKEAVRAARSSKVWRGGVA